MSKAPFGISYRWEREAAGAGPSPFDRPDSTFYRFIRTEWPFSHVSKAKGNNPMSLNMVCIREPFTGPIRQMGF